MYQKYLVTGAKDPVGRLVVQMLLSEGCQVRVLVPPETDYSLLKGMGAEIAEGEIFDKDSLKEFFDVEDPRNSAVIHTEEILSISSNKNLNMRRINVTGAENVIDMAMRAKIGRFVYLGSAYSLDPDSALSGETVHFDRKKADGDYAETKAEASAYLMEKVTLNKFNASLLLPTFIIGPGFSEDYDMNKILRKYLENKVSTVSGGHAFVDVRNVATALVAVCENGVPGGAYILNGEYKSSQEFFAEVAQTSGAEQTKEMPRWAQSKSMGKLVDSFYRITKKDNPKEVYALFMNSPEANYESNVEGILPESEVRKVHDSLVDVLSRPGNEVLPDRIPDLEKIAAEAAMAEPKEKPDRPVKEVTTVSEAVIKRAEESAARAAESGEEAEKRAAAAAAARDRVRAKVEAAKMKAEAEAAAAKAENSASASKAAESAPKAAPAVTPADKKSASDSFITRHSIADMMAQAEAKKAEEKKAAEAEAVIAPAAPIAAPVASKVAEEVVEPEPVAEPAVEPEPIVEEAPVAPAPIGPTPAPVAPEDNSGKPLWERLSSEDISEDEIFGDDKF
ncbi:MAG: NAD-dependent epimerase/dehydratase family protein [Clostridiales bacterium]|nr:NAD-dependent epimerase/dehydratase family protein [Clostridiales bacterium]